MDFPAAFSDKRTKFVNALDEVKSTMYHLLKVPIGEFLSSPQLGSYVDIHKTETADVANAIKMTIEEIPGVSCQSVVPKSDTSYTVNFTYKGDSVNFDLDLSKYYDTSRD